MDTRSFRRLKEQHGEHIIAHGVEESKGGLLNIVMMCISGTVKAQQAYWGDLVDGPPNISPLPHGPYFMVYDVSFGSTKSAPNNPSCSDIPYILLPCETVIDTLKSALDEAKLLGLIDQGDLDNFKEKIVTYDQLRQICDNHLELGEQATGINPTALFSASEFVSHAEVEPLLSPTAGGSAASR
jgi:hypothetical protein